MGCSSSSAVGIHDTHYIYVNRDHLLKPVLENQVRLLDPAWLVTWFKNKRPDDPPLSRCEDLNEKAFLDVNKLDHDQRQKLKIISVSYCWLAEDHPDPDCYHAETLVKMIECFQRSNYNNTHGSYGFVDEWHGGEKSDWQDAGFCFGLGEGGKFAIFWDFFSVPSTKDATEDMSIWQAHETTIKWVLSYLPPGIPKLPAYTDDKGIEHMSSIRAKHGESGWTFYEKRAAEFCTKPGDLLIVGSDARDVLTGHKPRAASGKKDTGSSRKGGVSHGLKSEAEKKQLKTKKRSNHLKKMSTSSKKQGKEPAALPHHQLHTAGELERHKAHDVAHHDYSHAGSYLQLVFDTLEENRELPMPPHVFEKELEKKRFHGKNVAETKALIIKNYNEMFKRFVSNASHLDFGGLNFESHEARHLLELVEKHCKMGVLHTIDLHTNEIALSLKEIAGALQKHRLHKLDLSGNLSVTGNLKDLRIQAPHLKTLDVTHTSAKGDIKDLRDWKKLGDIHAVGTDIGGDLSSITEMHLSALGLSDTKVTGQFSDLQSVPNIAHLKTLLLDDTGVVGNLVDLQVLKHLEVLHLSGSGVEGNFEDVVPLEHLTDLVLHETSVTGALRDISKHVSSTHEMKKLTRLDISGTKVEGDAAKIVNDINKARVHFTMPLVYINLLGTKVENLDNASLMRMFPKLDLKTCHFKSKAK